jgi:hypothetical protein
MIRCEVTSLFPLFPLIDQIVNDKISNTPLKVKWPFSRIANYDARDAGAEASVGSVGYAYENATDETINGLYRIDVIRRRCPCKSLYDA